MSTSSVLENVFGWLGTILWCIQLTPQVWMNYRRKTTAGLSPLLYSSWLVSGLCLGVYTILENINIPIIVQPHCYGSLCAVIFVQMLYYDRKWSKWRSFAAFAGYCVVGGGFEAGMYFAAKAGLNRGIRGPTMLFGILSDILIAVGFVPQFWQIYRDQEVMGLSYLFLFMDSLGAVFSIMSLAFKTSLDGIALAGYIAILVLEVLVVVLALILNPKANRRRAREAEEVTSQPGSLVLTAPERSGKADGAQGKRAEEGADMAHEKPWDRAVEQTV